MRMRMNVASPLRVGGREQQINKLEFVRHGGKVHAVSPRKLARRLLDRSERVLGDWNAEVLTRGQDADLTDFLHRQSLLDPRTLAEISRYSVPDAAGVKNELFPHARDAHGRLFIPGTAIKGAIRAAVMWELVDEDEANRYVQTSKSNKARFYASNLDRGTLQSYELPHRRLRAGPHHDLLRAVKVADAYGELDSRIEKILIQSYTEQNGNRNASLGAGDTIYVECLAPGSWAELDLKVDQKILRDFRQGSELPFTDEESLLRLVQDFYSAVWEFERRYYGVGAKEGEPEPSSGKPEEFPSQEEWITKKYGEMSKTQQRRYRGEYRMAREEFETSQGQGEGSKDDGVSAVRDGREMRLGEVREFYSGSSPGFRLGWGSGLMSTTVDLRLDEENVGKVLNVISRRHHPHATPREGPKSRKLVGEGRDPRWPMGWASLEVAE